MTVLIVGGYGVVGAQIARILRRRNPRLPLLIGGRNVDKAASLAAELGGASGVHFDVDDRASLGNLPVCPALIVVAVNDLRDATLTAAIDAGIALVDITRWTARVRTLEQLAARQPLRAPLVQGSSWMACVPGALALAAAAPLQRVNSIDIGILYALQDKSGDNSVDYMDRLSLPFAVMRDGRPGIAIPFSEGRKLRFANGYRTRVYRFDTPDQHILPRLTRARSVAARIAFDDKATMAVFWLVIRSGLWKLLSGERFTPLRRGLLHQPGPGALHQVRVDLSGKAGGAPVKHSIQISDAAGQTHMTAVGAALQVEWALGLNGFTPPAAGLCYGESLGLLPGFEAALASEGVRANSISE